MILDFLFYQYFRRQRKHKEPVGYSVFMAPFFVATYITASSVCFSGTAYMYFNIDIFTNIIMSDSYILMSIFGLSIVLEFYYLQNRRYRKVILSRKYNTRLYYFLAFWFLFIFLILTVFPKVYFSKL